MEVMRLVVTGPVGAGKSTFIRAISEIEAVDTDRIATDETKLLKKRTTVAFDFGRLQFSPEMALHLYGTPGQSRFDFMWEMLINKASGYILLVAANQPGQFLNARRIMGFMNQRTKIPMIIGVTHSDCPGAWPPENLAIALGFSKAKNCPPIVVVNADQTNSVANAIIILIQQLMQGCTV